MTISYNRRCLDILSHETFEVSNHRAVCVSLIGFQAAQWTLNAWIYVDLLMGVTKLQGN
jgi:hypothetical protein